MKINFLIAIAMLLLSNTSANALELGPVFQACHQAATNECKSKGEPAQLLPSFRGLDASGYYPDQPPPGVVSESIVYQYNCLYTNPAFPGTLNFSSGNLATRCGLVASDPPKYKIDSFRIGQRIFDPSLNQLGSVDLVANKSFGIEITVSAELPEFYKYRWMIAHLYIGGSTTPFASSNRFSSFDMLNPNAKIFLFTNGLPEGTYDFKIVVEPLTDFLYEPFYLGPRLGVSSSKRVTVHKVPMNIIYNIISCIPDALPCFAQPSQADIDFFNKDMRIFAIDQLPVSSSDFLVSRGSDFSKKASATSGGAEGIVKDLQNIWLQKKLSKKDVGITIVGQDYFLKQLSGLRDADTLLGVTDHISRNVALMRAWDYSTLAHELVHIGGGSDTHAVPDLVPGMHGLFRDSVWTDGFSLDSTVKLSDTSKAWNFYSGEKRPAGTAAINQNLDVVTYNKVFATFKAGKVDPPAKLVVGIIRENKLESIEMISGETFLDPETADSDLEMQGLDQNGQIVSSIKIKTSGKLLLSMSDGSSVDLPLGFQSFVGTLPDENNQILSLRILKDGVVIPPPGTEPPSPPVLVKDLAFIMKNISAESFKGSKLIAALGYTVAKKSYDRYLSLLSKKKYKDARTSLTIMYADFAILLKDEFNLKDNSQLKKTEALGLIKAEGSTIPNKYL